MKDLVLITRPEVADEEERLLDLAEWMGVATRKVTVPDRPHLDQLAAQTGDRACAAISLETLAFLHERLPSEVLQSFVGDRCEKLLVFCVGRDLRHGAMLAWLTGGVVTGLALVGEPQAFHVPERSRHISAALAGQSFTGSRFAPPPTFKVGGASQGIERILLANDHLSFGRLRRGSCEVFLLALAELPDIGERLSPRSTIEEHYEQLIPLLIFLRHCFGLTCWHGIGSTACLIIDDPLLRPKYGFLDYDALRHSMYSAGYATSIAFIPWNHWRTSRSAAADILGRDPNLSICIHGCDHTNREFSKTDPGSLQRMADMALHRMQRHKSRTGIGCDPVMVFPQGKFSSSAMRALRASGYLAAVNTTCFPTDVDAEPLTIGDFLRPAVTRFHGFPLFPRRYPRRLIDFAFDVFIGRPVLIVQHHDDFRDGCRHQEEFVAGLYRIEPELQWGHLSTQLMRSCMMRSLSDRSMEVRFFTKQFRFRNVRPTAMELLLSRDEPEPSAISGVLVDGTSVPFSFRDGLLVLEYRVDANQMIEVTILDRPRSHVPRTNRPRMGHALRVSVRRALSEFRDEALVRHPRLLAIAKHMAAGMRVSGEDVE